jgi:hypothetical protein
LRRNPIMVGCATSARPACFSVVNIWFTINQLYG